MRSGKNRADVAGAIASLFAMEIAKRYYNYPQKFVGLSI